MIVIKKKFYCDPKLAIGIFGAGYIVESIGKGNAGEEIIVEIVGVTVLIVF
jgi:hypothetical protein